MNVRFPTPREKLRATIAEYKDASAEDRIMAMLELTCLCDEILASSPNRERQIQILEENERLENKSWRELIDRHARR